MDTNSVLKCLFLTLSKKNFVFAVFFPWFGQDGVAIFV